MVSISGRMCVEMNARDVKIVAAQRIDVLATVSMKGLGVFCAEDRSRLEEKTSRCELLQTLLELILLILLGQVSLRVLTNLLHQPKQHQPLSSHPRLQATASDNLLFFL